MNNPYLLRIYDTMEDNDYIYIIMEYCNQGTLQDALNKYKCLQENNALEIFYSIVLGLSALSFSGIVHRDLNTKNILVDTSRRTAKLCDYGCAIMVNRVNTKYDNLVDVDTGIGTVCWWAPEIFTESAQRPVVD